MDLNLIVTWPKLFLLLLMIVVALSSGKRGRRWLIALGPLALLAALVPWPDAVSMLFSFAFLVGVFSLGMYWGPRLRAPQAQDGAG